MSDESNAYAVVIADLKRRRAEIDSMIANLEGLEVAGGDPSPFADAGATPPAREGAGQEPPAGNNSYLGMRIPQATIALLTAKRTALRPAEIVKALEEGGLILTGKNNANTVNSVLHRRQAQVGDVVSPKRGHWGLKEWYPGRVFVRLGETSRGGAKKGDAEQPATEPTEPEQPSEPSRIVPLRSSGEP